MFAVGKQRGAGRVATAGLSLRGRKKRGSVTPTETNAHRDALCFMDETWVRHKTLENSTKKWLAVGGGWRLAVGGWWRLIAAGGWRLVGRLVIFGGCP